MSLLVAKKSLKIRLVYDHVHTNGDWAYYLESNDDAYLERVIDCIKTTYPEFVNVSICGDQIDYSKHEEGVSRAIIIDRENYHYVIGAYKAMKGQLK